MEIRRSYLLLAVIMASILVFSCDLNVNNAYNGDPLENATYADQNYCIGYNPEVSNTDVVTNFLKDLKAGKSLKLLSYLSNDIEWTIAGNQATVPFVGTYNRIKEVIRSLYLFYRTVKIDDLVTTTLTEVDTSHLEAYVRLQGKIYSTQKTIDIEFRYTWQMNAKHKIEKIAVSYPLVSLELAFTPGGKGNIVADLQVSQLALTITNSLAATKARIGNPAIPVEQLKSPRIAPPALPADATVETLMFNEVPADFVHITGERDDKVVLHLHGGAFITMYPGQALYRYFDYALAKELNIPVLDVDYRWAPENPFPAGLEDCFAVYQAILNQYNPEDIILLGDSAGGNLVFAVLELAKENSLPMPGAVICLSPWLDISDSGETMITNADSDTYLPKIYLDRCAAWYLTDTGIPADDPLVSPLFADFDGLPPVYLTASTTEILLSDSTRMFTALANRGNDVTIELTSGLCHVWPGICRGTTDSQRTLSRIGDFVKDKLNLE